MNYEAHYNKLIERARNRTLEEYSEKHHIVPRCMGGGNEKSNVVRLTAEEHYVAHQLLVRMFPGDHRLLWAAVNMTNGSGKQRRRGNKLYGWLRRKFGKRLAERNRGRIVSDETRKKMSAAKAGKKRAPHSDETKRKMSAAAKGRPKSAEHRVNMGKVRLGKKRRPRTDEEKRKISEANKLTWKTRRRRTEAKSTQVTRQSWKTQTNAATTLTE